MQQMNIIKQLAKTTAEVGCEAGDLAHLFYNDRDRRERKLSPDRLKVCRAKAKRAVHSLKERGLVDIFYSQSLAPTAEYQVQKLFVGLTGAGQVMASQLIEGVSSWTATIDAGGSRARAANAAEMPTRCGTYFAPEMAITADIAGRGVRRP